MFTCDRCKEVSPRGWSVHPVVTQTKPAKYIQIIQKGQGEKKYEKEVITTGVETVREEKHCGYCFNHIARPPAKKDVLHLEPYVRKQLKYDVLPTYFPWQLHGQELKDFLK